MSKSLGNGVDPNFLISRYSADGLRYLLLHSSKLDSDSDFDLEAFDLAYKRLLHSKLGSVVFRSLSLSIFRELKFEKAKISLQTADCAFVKRCANAYDLYDFALAIQYINEYINSINEYISKSAPWNMPSSELNCYFGTVYKYLVTLAIMSNPILPERSALLLNGLQVEPNQRNLKLLQCTEWNFPFLTTETIETLLQQFRFPALPASS